MRTPTGSQEKGFITILTGLYSFQDCVHFLASVRKFHKEPIIILIDQVPWFLRLILQSFKDVYLVPASSDKNPVLASRFAKISLYRASPFEKTIYLDCDTCLLDNINEVFEALDNFDLLLTEDIRPRIADAVNLLRVEQDFDTKHDVLTSLQKVGLPVTEETVQYNGGFIAFRKAAINKEVFDKFENYFKIILENQDLFLLRDQGPLAASIAALQPRVQVMSPRYNFLSKWKNVYSNFNDSVKVLHCTYPMRPQYAKDVTKSLFTRIFDRLAKYLLPNQVKNPWRKAKANLSKNS
ncbi:MAG TPA: hypothetical protein V6D07_07915 [Trichocoleus sp.]